MKAFWKSGGGWVLLAVYCIGLYAAGHLGLVSLTDAIKATVVALACLSVVGFFLWASFGRDS